MEGKEGWVYVLTNEAMPGLVKVGYTMKDPAIRAEELYKDSKNGAVTGVPMPFVVAYRALVVNPYQVEQAVHKELESRRINDNREFFKCSTEEAVEHIRQVAQAKFEEEKIVYKTTDGGEYLGSLNEQRRPHGYGTRKYGDGAKYEGYFENGFLHGQGTFTWPDGTEYVGEFFEDERNGYGTQTWPDGFRYIGKWKNEKRTDSYAQFFYPDGHKYYGGFQDDKRHGSGTMTFPDGKQRSGRWENGELVKWDSSPTENAFEAFQYIYGGGGLLFLIGFYLYYFLF